MTNTKLDLSKFTPVNFLWNEFSETFGQEKAYKAISQAIDVHNMNGIEETLPVLFIETGGIGLVNIQVFKNQTGLSLHGKSQVLIVSIKKKSLQLLQRKI